MRAGMLLLILALGLSACTLFESADGEMPPSSSSSVPLEQEDGAGLPTDTLPDVDPGPAPEAGNGELFELLGPEDRIVVQSERQDLSILTFGGEQPVPTDNDATQPVFSPDGSRLAWTSFTPDLNTGTIVFGTLGREGAVTVDAEVETPVVSFYSVWAPGSNETLAVLGNAAGGVGVGVVNDESSTDVLDSGVPYYFTWTDTADALVGHVGSALRTFDLAGEEGTDQFAVANSFQAPVLVQGGAAIVAIENPVAGRSANALVRVSIGTDGAVDPETTQLLAQFDGRASLFLSPDRQRLAVVIQGGGGVAQVVASRGQEAPALARGAHIIELATGGITTIRTDAVRAVFWAPNSELIAGLAFNSLGDGRPYSTWTVHDSGGGEISVSPRFVISGQFEGAYLPFIDQYVQAVTVWSPDSTRFVFPGSSVAGDEGIWLHRLPGPAGDSATFRISEGVVAFWSPASHSTAPAVE